MAVNRSIFKNGLIGLLRFYRYLLSYLLGPCCRFEPSCSVYAISALEMHGLCQGSFLMLKRVCKCHPWHPGGYDPVPLNGSIRSK